MKKKIVICIAVVVALVLLIPIPMRLKDGGSVVYQAVLYSVKDVHSLNPDMESGAPYKEGINITEADRLRNGVFQRSSLTI